MAKMSSPTRPMRAAKYAVVCLLLWRVELILGNGEKSQSCPSPCTCIDTLLDCARHKLEKVPGNLPLWIEQL